MPHCTHMFNVSKTEEPDWYQVEGGIVRNDNWTKRKKIQRGDTIELVGKNDLRVSLAVFDHVRLFVRSRGTRLSVSRSLSDDGLK